MNSSIEQENTKLMTENQAIKEIDCELKPVEKFVNNTISQIH